MEEGSNIIVQYNIIPKCVENCLSIVVSNSFHKMDKSIAHVLIATIFLCLLVLNVNAIAATSLYFTPSENDSKLSMSPSASESSQVHFPTKDEIIAAQKQLGPEAYFRISNASEGPPSQVQGVTVTNTTAINGTAADNSMFVTWIGNETTVYLYIIHGEGPSIQNNTVFPAKTISLNNTMNASNLQITALPGLTSITWDAIDAETGMRNVYGSLSRDGKNFYSFQISSGLNNAYNPRQPNPHFVLYTEEGNETSVCKGPILNNGSEVSNLGINGNVTSQAANSSPGLSAHYECLYRWA